MLVPQKCQYALRAIFELAKAYGDGPVKIAQIAQTQAIPARFLEVILNQLRQGGFVDSRRGSDGGYRLARSPAKLTVGDIMRFLQGSLHPVDCSGKSSKRRCSLYGNCVFLPMWQRVAKAISDVYDATSFEQLVEDEERMASDFVPSYSI